MRISPEPPSKAPTLDPSEIEIALRVFSSASNSSSGNLAFSKFAVEVLGGKVAASIALVPAARQAEVGAMAEVARGRIPFQNWVEPSMRRQGQLQPQVNRMPREGIHCFNNIARCTILSKGGSA